MSVVNKTMPGKLHLFLLQNISIEWSGLEEKNNTKYYNYADTHTDTSIIIIINIVVAHIGTETRCEVVY